MEEIWTQIRPVGELDPPWGIENDERSRRVFLARRLRTSAEELREFLRSFGSGRNAAANRPVEANMFFWSLLSILAILALTTSFHHLTRLRPEEIRAVRPPAPSNEELEAVTSRDSAARLRRS